MALRRWRGVLAQTGVQTGDSRGIQLNALEWPDLPLPLGWLEHEQHGDLLSGAVQVGNVDTLAMVGDDAVGGGIIDDAIPEGAELIRRLEAGSAALGNRVGLSIDPDNWSVEIVDTTGEMEELLLVASGVGLLPNFRSRQSVLAAAGDPLPTDGDVLYSESVGDILERFTRLRVRGVTACAVAAFAGAYLELDGEAAESDEEAPAEEPAVVTASAPVRPPAAWFSLPEPQPGQTDDGSVYGMPVQELLIEQPDGSFGVPVTITEDGRVFGHAALWSTCHVGYLGECVTAPESQSGYAHFHVGSVETREGRTINTGALTVSCDHAAADLLAPEARDHYANSGLAFADVRATNGELGVWISGALRPSITEDQLRILRASSLSGDWRRIGADAFGRGGALEFIAALAVNVPGFPIAREYVTASGLSMPRASMAASAHVDNGQVMSLVASGVVQRCSDCAQRQRQAEMDAGDGPLTVRASAELIEMVRRIELRTRHLVPTAAEHALSVVKRGEALRTDLRRVENVPIAPARVLRPRKRS